MHLQGALGRTPTAAEVAPHVGVTPHATRARVRLLRETGAWPEDLTVLTQGQTSGQASRWGAYWATFDRLTAELGRELGREPTYRELSAEHGVSPQAIHSSMTRSPRGRERRSRA